MGQCISYCKCARCIVDICIYNLTAHSSIPCSPLLGSLHQCHSLCPVCKEILLSWLWALVWTTAVLLLLHHPVPLRVVVYPTAGLEPPSGLTGTWWRLLRAPLASKERLGFTDRQHVWPVVYHNVPLNLPNTFLCSVSEYNLCLTAINEATFTWSGQLPPRHYQTPIYSCKVFLGGVPWDITEGMKTFASASVCVYLYCNVLFFPQLAW